MVPEIDILLKGIGFTTRQVFMPELRGPFARTQALALVQVVEILRERVAKQQIALLDETAALREGLRQVDEAVTAGGTSLSRERSDELRTAIAAQLVRRYPEHLGQRTLEGLSAERLDLRALHVRIMEALCEGTAYDDPRLDELRGRLRSRYMADFGLSTQFVAVWADALPAE